MSAIDNENLKIGLVVMASGLSKRFGSNKLVAELAGKPLIRWVLDVTEDLFDRRVVVTRSDEVKSLCESLHVDCILHKFPNRNDTVRLGLNALMGDVDYCFFTPGDQPLISRDSIIKLICEAKTHRDSIIRTSFGYTVGSPAGFPRSLFDELLNLPEGKGGGFIINNREEIVRKVEVESKYELFDVDTTEDLGIVEAIVTRDGAFATKKCFTVTIRCT